MASNIEKCVTIYLNGEAMLVKVRTFSEQETRDVLGVEPDDHVALEHALHCPLDFSRGWGFAEGQRYAVVVDEMPVGDPEEQETPPWVADSDAWKGEGWRSESDGWSG